MEDEHGLLYAKYNSCEQLWKRLIANISLVTHNAMADQRLNKIAGKNTRFSVKQE